MGRANNHPPIRRRGRSAAFAALWLAAVLSSGCTVCESAKNVLVTQPKEFFWERDRKESRALYLAWAEEAWANEALRGACGSDSPDYAWGFREGFADFVYGGGTGEPPAVPPRPYWNAMNRTAEGKAAADAWFAGYRHGASAARAGGYRDQAVVRSSIAKQVGYASPVYNPATVGPVFQGPPIGVPAIEGELIPLPQPSNEESIPIEGSRIERGPSPVEIPPATDDLETRPPAEPSESDAPGLEFPGEPAAEPARGDRSAQRAPSVVPTPRARRSVGDSLLRY